MSMENLRVSLDNGVTWTEVREVRIIASDPLVEDEVHITVTGEGVVTDIVDEGKVIGAQSRSHFDAIAELE